MVSGPDQPGLVAAVTALVTRNRANIVSLDQFSDNPEGGAFFQRLVFHRPDLAAALPEIEADLAATLEPYGMQWRLTDQSVPKRMAILASTSDHCLLDLLWRHRRGELPVTVPLVISNHTHTAEDVRSFGIPFVHVPSQGCRQIRGRGGDPPPPRGQRRLRGARALHADPLRDFIARLGVPVINIHHSFLPAFVGAGAYKRAKERGVKLIGATSHYVTADLDEGPIIEQDVVRVTHADTAADLQRRGADVERAVLSRAVLWHAQDRVIRHGNHTIVF